MAVADLLLEVHTDLIEDPVTIRAIEDHTEAITTPTEVMWPSAVITGIMVIQEPLQLLLSFQFAL